jgi:hypothetical protein
VVQLWRLPGLHRAPLRTRTHTRTRTRAHTHHTKQRNSLPALLRAKGRAAWDAVQGCLLPVLRQLDADARISAAGGLRLAVQQRWLGAADAADALLPLALAHSRPAGDAPDEVRARGWLCAGRACAAACLA